MIEIAGRKIGREYSPFIIAEMSGNHNQSLERALNIVEEAAKIGVDALKIQTYTADEHTLNLKEGEFQIINPNSLWNGYSLYDLYSQGYTPWEWHEAIFNKCKNLGIIYFSSPVSIKAVDFLESLNVPCYKVASFELVDFTLLKRIARTKKPVILSTGMATVAEIDEAVTILRKNGCEDIILLKCTSTYPASPEDTNILTIPHMRDLFNCEVGISDHTMGIGVSVASVALGATVIERHFTLSRVDGGIDSEFSMEPEELTNLVTEAGRAWQSLGKVNYGITKREEDSKIFRRSLYIVEDLKAGDILTEKNLRSIRPGMGLLPKYYEIVIGKTIKKDVKRGTPLSWDLI